MVVHQVEVPQVKDAKEEVKEVKLQKEARWQKVEQVTVARNRYSVQEESKKPAQQAANKFVAPPVIVSTTTQKRGLFKYQVLNGNNASLVRRVMQETRSFLWTEVSSTSAQYNFRWSPISKWVNFERLSHSYG